MFRDLCFAFRTWRRNPAFAAAAGLTLALGIALNTSLFGVVNAVWFRPLLFPQPDRLVFLHQAHERKGFRQFVSEPVYEAWTKETRSYEALGALGERGFTVTGADGAEQVRGAVISASLLDLLGQKPVRGRGFTSADEAPAAPRVVMISQRYWENRLGRAEDAVGRTLRIDGAPATVIGVAPHGFRLLYSGYQVLAPLRPGEKREDRFLQVVGRLGAGLTREQAQAEATMLARRAGELYPMTDAGWETRVLPLKDVMWADARRLYLSLMAASGLLLLLICANISNLLLVRAAGRRREMALRVALGAERGRLARQVLVEGGALALAGGALAFLLCVWACRAITAASPAVKELVVDWRVFLFTLGVSLASGLVFGLGPALAASKPDLNNALKSSAAGGGRGRIRMGSVLTVVQLALASSLVMTAGLVVRSILEIRSADAGFDTRGLLTASLTLSGPRYASAERQSAFVEAALDWLAAIPGVTAAGGATALPLMGGDGRLRLEIEGRPAHRDGEIFEAGYAAVSAEYFRAVGIGIERGRGFSAGDREGAPAVAIVNRTFARTFWDDPAKAIGARVRVGDGEWRRIVGIAGDARQVLTRPALPQIHVPLRQEPGRGLQLALRTAGGAPSGIAPAVRAAIRELDPEVPLAYVQTMETVVEDYFPRPVALVLAVFSVIALVLASTGMYGVASFQVSRRTSEFGVRLALGAGPSALWRLVLGGAMKLTAAGLALGVAAGLGLGRVLARYLYGVSPADAAVFGVVCAVLAAVTLAACAVPARRATRIDATAALRAE